MAQLDRQNNLLYFVNDEDIKLLNSLEIAFLSQNYDFVIEHIDLLCSKFPDNVDLHIIAFDTYAELEQYNKAYQHALSIQKIRPDHPYVQSMIDSLEAKIDRISHIEQIQRFYSESSQIVQDEGSKLNQSFLKLCELERKHASDPTDLETLIHMALLAFNVGDTNKGVEYSMKIIQLDLDPTIYTTQADCYVYLAEKYFSIGRPDIASHFDQMFLDNLIAFTPNDIVVLIMKYLDEDNIKSITEIFKKAYDITHEDIYLQYMLSIQQYL